MPPTRLPLVVRLGGIRSLLSFCAIMTAGLAAALSPMAVAMWEPALAAVTLLPALLGVGGIAYYLRRGLLQAATHTEGGYQLFSTSELLRLHFIRTAQHLGFTLGEIEEIMAVMEVPEVMGATAMPTTHPMASMRAVASGH